MLRTAADLTDALVVVAGVTGAVAGGLLFRDGGAGPALAVWVLTFIAGAVLRLAAWIARGVAELLGRLAALEQRMATPPAHPAEPPHPDRGRWHR